MLDLGKEMMQAAEAKDYSRLDSLAELAGIHLVELILSEDGRSETGTLYDDLYRTYLHFRRSTGPETESSPQFFQGMFAGLALVAQRGCHYQMPKSWDEHFRSGLDRKIMEALGDKLTQVKDLKIDGHSTKEVSRRLRIMANKDLIVRRELGHAVLFRLPSVTRSFLKKSLPVKV